MPQANARARFDETVEISINLGTNPKRGDQAVRGTALLPFGTGKALRIAAFAEGEDAVAASAAGVSHPSAVTSKLPACIPARSSELLHSLAQLATSHNSVAIAAFMLTMSRVQQQDCSSPSLACLTTTMQNSCSPISSHVIWYACSGADVVGGEELIQQIQASGNSSLNFDKAVAVPAIMPKLSKIARILGPRGLMPNPKLGTLSTDIEEAIRLLKTGKVEFRADRGAVLHAGLGKASFGSEKLHSNVGALCSAILNVRPKGVKGSGMSGYFLTASLTSTMGRSVPVSVSSLSQAATTFRASQR